MLVLDTFVIILPDGEEKDDQNKKKNKTNKKIGLFDNYYRKRIKLH